ncbi:AI-2E family transporter [Fervidibacillus halotolerans]|uniref:AI-2E family transporter n=1 Tax=Fervidibacillus halotolerans TaxID=2980027 RepID=A0A9E8RXT9_9BACI|nr:AI-2E family transporter [Fervidibacillus halotolerans]WAA11549.1 AI-2E family transporter [Fervidibacillus halotolerans]
MDIKVKWFYRLGFFLLLFAVLFIFIKLEPLWKPIVNVVAKGTAPFFIATFIAYLLHPFVKKLSDYGLQKWLSVFIIYVLFFATIGGAIFKGTPIFIRQLKDLSENAPLLFDQYEKWVDFVETETKGWPFTFKQQVEESFQALNRSMEGLVEKAVHIVFWLADKLLIILLIPFITFYMLKDFDYLKGVFFHFIPKRCQKQTVTFLQNVDESLGNYIRGQLIVCGTVGVASAFLFWLIGLDYPLLFGTLVGVTNVIPYFGPIIGAIPVVIVASTNSVKMVIFVLLIIFGIQFLEANILSPVIVGKSLKMHPLLIMFSILIGGEIGGIIGLLVAVPFVAILKTAISQGLEQFRKQSI